MPRLVLKPEKRKKRRVGETLRLGRLRKFDHWSLKAFVKRLDFAGLPYGTYVEAGWVMGNDEKIGLYIHTRIGVRDVNDRRRRIHLGGGALRPKLPKGKYISEKWILGMIYESIRLSLEHELQECMHLDGHTVFDPHTRTGRQRLESV